MNIYDMKVIDINNEEVSISKYKGKVLLIVNTATGCGFTHQYAELENLYEKYHLSGFEILDFPCDQFGHQAPGTDEEIHEFCTLNYNVKFDQFSKIEVNGENESELFKYLKKKIPKDEINGLKDKLGMKALEKISTSANKKSDIKWNFTKFLVDREGNVVKRYPPTKSPEKLERDIEELLKGDDNDESN